MFVIDAIPQAFRKKWVSKKTRAFLWATSGTVLEYYDYALYGVLAPFFAQDFFPNADPTIALLKIFAVFFVGSLAKPLGGLIFGMIGDRWGTHQSLRISIMGMVLATFFMGILPGYAQWGSFAAFCLLGCRFLQGMSVVGESDSMQLFIYEQFGNKKSCFANSLCCMAWKIGIGLGAVAYGWVMQQSNPSSYYRWPFIVGSALGLFVFWKRKGLVEKKTETISFLLKKDSIGDMLSLILKNKKMLLATLCLCGSVGGCYHFYFTFLVHYAQKWPDLFINFSPFLVPCGLFIYAASSVLGALMADKIGALAVMRMAGSVLCLLSILQIFVIIQGQLPLMLIACIMIGLGAFQAPAFVGLFQRLKMKERCRTVFLGHAMGSLLFSGSTPVISLWTWKSTQWVVAPFFYFVFLIMLGFLGISLLKKETMGSWEML